MLICRSFCISDMPEVRGLLHQVPLSNRGFFLPHLYRDTFVWVNTSDDNLVGMVIFSPCQLFPEYYPLRPSDRVMMECLIVRPGHNLRYLFRLFYRQYDFSSVRFPLYLIAHPATSHGMKLDNRLGFKPYTGKFLFYYASKKEKLPLF